MESHGHTGAFLVRARDDEMNARWDRLARDVGASPFARPGWLGAWSSSFDLDVRLATVERGARLVAVLPIVATPGRVRTASNWHVPHTEVVAVDSEAVITLLRGLDHEFRRVTLDFVLEGSLTELIASDCFESRPQRRIIRQQSPFIDSTSGWDQYRETLSTKKLRELRRRRRRLGEQAGVVTYEVVDGAGDWAAVLEAGMAVEASGWKGDAGTAVLSDPATERFYRSVARWAASEKLLEVGVLRAGDRVVAFDLSLCDGRSTWLLKTGFDHDLSTFAPGQMLRHDAIAAAFERGLATYEFTGGAEPWKDEWTTDRRPVLMIDVFKQGPAGIIESQAARVARVIRVGARRLKAYHR